METPSTIPTATLAEWVVDAGRRTLDLVADLTGEQLLGPRLPTINPPLWEIGHLAWFMEKWVLRDGGKRPSLRADADALYDSAAIPHAVRWDLPLPSRAATLDYLGRVREGVLDVLARSPSKCEQYFSALSIFHEDMHGEAFLYTRQLLAYPRPQSCPLAPRAGSAGPLPGDVMVPGGTFLLGATPNEPFVFDNEKWAHSVELAPFAIARAPVTQAEFAAFVEAGGYARRELWTDAGWSWRESAQAEHPVYWRRDGGWLRREFDEWVPLESHRPVIHVNWYEADAYCRWAGRRLPTEAEWEAAAAGPGPKRRFPWGDDPPDTTRANLDGTSRGCCEVAAHPAGDSAFGCRQMFGNVWEWTATAFGPYPGFVPDPYKEYSQPWFGTHKVLRGGAWPTRARLIRNTWRNFFTPDRRDMWAGFRTCAVD
jgi:iron(II)-dependent oxidoreductase